MVMFSHLVFEILFKFGHNNQNFDWKNKNQHCKMKRNLKMWRPTVEVNGNCKIEMGKKHTLGTSTTCETKRI